MALDLNKPLAWRAPDVEAERVLRALQGNILKSHGRPATANLFFRIDPAKKHAMRASLRELAHYHVTSALKQLVETDTFQATGQGGSTFVAVFLSAKGYAALGVPAAETPDDPRFRAGMKSSTGLGDPPVSAWEAPFQGEIGGMVLVGSTDDTALRRERDAVRTLLTDGGATILLEQAGHEIRNQFHEGIEHFGYVDGRSQPLPLVEDLEREARDAGIAAWNPAAPLRVALVEEKPVGQTVTPSGGPSFGSYFVFRKLEQNVRGFKRREQELATALGLTGEARERAGALVVGRFEDGTPVTMADEAKGLTPPNDFNYKGDAGTRCPFHAHIRKTNPRGTGGTGGKAPDDEFKHLMLRRGIPYEDEPRRVHPSDVPGSETVAEFDAKAGPLLPTGKVGLLFMAYNRDLGDQFEFTQATWANNNDFPKDGPPPKLDPVIGQGAAVAQIWPKAWDDPNTDTKAFPFSGFVTMKGGEYFFAPSLTFLRAL